MNVERAEYNEALRAIKDEFWRPDDTRCMIDFFLVLEHDLSEDDYIGRTETPAEELCQNPEHHPPSPVATKSTSRPSSGDLTDPKAARLHACLTLVVL